MNIVKALKCLVFDLETAPMIAYVWGRNDQNIGLNQLKTDSSILAWGAKWLNDAASKFMYKDQRDAKVIEDDRKLLLPLWKLLDEADIVITQNGKNFDSPRLNARFIFHGMKPPSPYKHLDTYQIARKVAKFTSNSLAYLTENLCTKYKKSSHSRYPGMELWKECLAGNRDAWDEMKRYNRHDVLSTEELYHRLKAWAPKAAMTPFLVADAGISCATCGQSNLQKRGYAVTKKAMYPRYQCRECGVWQQGNLVPTVLP